MAALVRPVTSVLARGHMGCANPSRRYLDATSVRRCGDFVILCRYAVPWNSILGATDLLGRYPHIKGPAGARVAAKLVLMECCSNEKEVEAILSTIDVSEASLHH